MEDKDSICFRQQLLALDENLGKEDVDALKFLCSDFISLKNLEAVEAAHDIFQLLINNNLLNKEDTFIIAELLYRIKCIFLLQKIGYNKEKVLTDLPFRGKVSEYRQMLYDISEELTETDVKTAMFLLRDHLPKKQSTTSALELLASLEKQDLLGENKLYILEKICNPELLKKVERYKERAESRSMAQSSHPAFQETYFGMIQEPSVRYPPNIRDSPTEEFKSLGVYRGSYHSLPAVQDVKAGNASGPSEISFPVFVGNDKSKNAAKTSACYKMDGPHRGYCLIFNNVNFEGGLKQRKGSEKDAEELEGVFTWLGLEVKQYDNKTSMEIENLLKDWESESWRDKDCLVCCILSHGESGNIYGTDGQLLSIRSIMSHFTAKKCPQLAKKPKLFFIQACQGEKTQQPVYLDMDGNIRANLGADAQSSGFFSSQQLTSSIPEEADFLLGMATVDGYLSFRHVQYGTWYIQALCDKLRTLVPRGEDILSILTEVNADVSRRADSQGQKKQMPQPAYTLRKKLIFPVPKETPLH